VRSQSLNCAFRKAARAHCAAWLRSPSCGTESREATMTAKAGAGEVIIEMRPVGSVVRVAAVDVATGTEVIVFGPATTPPRALEELAIAKLKRRLSTDRAP
jgi:hypothetical protein